MDSMATKGNKYELMIALKPLLPDDVRRAIHKEILSLTEQMEGEVLDINVWGKRYLAYEIEGHNEGYYILYQLQLPSSSITEIKRLLGLKAEILRYMVVKIEKDEELGNTLKKKSFNEDIDLTDDVKSEE